METYISKCSDASLHSHSRLHFSIDELGDNCRYGLIGFRCQSLLGNIGPCFGSCFWGVLTNNGLTHQSTLPNQHTLSTGNRSGGFFAFCGCRCNLGLRWNCLLQQPNSQTIPGSRSSGAPRNDYLENKFSFRLNICINTVL